MCIWAICTAVNSSQLVTSDAWGLHMDGTFTRTVLDQTHGAEVLESSDGHY